MGRAIMMFEVNALFAIVPIVVGLMFVASMILFIIYIVKEDAEENRQKFFQGCVIHLLTKTIFFLIFALGFVMTENEEYVILDKYLDHVWMNYVIGFLFWFYWSYVAMQ